MDLRFVPQTLEYRAEDGKPTLFGVAIRFDSWSQDLGGFRERIAPGAMDDVFARSDRDIRAYRNHDPDQILGRESANTLRLTLDEEALRFELDLDDTSYALDTFKSVKRGDISGMSFGFLSDEDRWEEGSTRNDLMSRTVIKMSVMPEISIVTNAAYLTTEVSAAKRSLELANSLNTRSQIQMARRERELFFLT